VAPHFLKPLSPLVPQEVLLEVVFHRQIEVLKENYYYVPFAPLKRRKHTLNVIEGLGLNLLTIQHRM
jgi:hypothetical protein